MSNPQVSTLVIPQAIQNFSLEYTPPELINERVAPIVSLPSLQSKVLKYQKGNLFQFTPGQARREIGTRRHELQFQAGMVTANPQQYSEAIPIPDELIELMNTPGQLPLKPLQDATKKLIWSISMEREYQISKLIFSPASAAYYWADATSGGTDIQGHWGLATTSNTFKDDIWAAKSAILNASGKEPNVLVIDYSTFMAQKKNPNIRDDIKYTQLAITTVGLLAELLELDEVIVAKSMYDAGPDNINDTLSTPTSFTKFWNPSGKGNAFLFYREAPAMYSVASLYQYRFPYKGSLRYMRTYYDEQTSSQMMHVTEYVDPSPVALDTGWVFKNCITA
jgi:hypothetical protein